MGKRNIFPGRISIFIVVFRAFLGLQHLSLCDHGPLDFCKRASVTTTTTTTPPPTTTTETDACYDRGITLYPFWVSRAVCKIRASMKFLELYSLVEDLCLFEKKKLKTKTRTDRRRTDGQTDRRCTTRSSQNVSVDHPISRNHSPRYHAYIFVNCNIKKWRSVRASQL